MTSLDDWDDNDFESCEVNVEITSAEANEKKITEIVELISDMTISSQNRITLVENLYERDKILFADSVSNICISYLDNGVESLKTAIVDITKIEILPFPIRLYCSLTLTTPPKFEEEEDYKPIQKIPYIESLLELLINSTYKTQEEKLQLEISHTLLFDELVKLVVKYPQYEKQVSKCISDIMTFEKLIEESVRYRMLLQIIDQRRNFPLLVENSVIAFFYTRLSHTYSVYSAQLLHNWFLLNDSHIEILFERCIDDASKAEICDFLLGIDHVKDRAKEILFTIKESNRINLFKSSQNVHQVSADLEGFIERLLNFDPTDMKTVENCLMNMENSHKSELKSALTRITLDQALYSKKTLTLQSILCRLFSFIMSHESKETLMQRLLEECIDMSDTCSSGHLLRLINVCSGFENGITVNVRDEIRGVVNHRLNKLIMCLPDEQRDKILEDLTNMTQEVIQKDLFPQLAILHDELWNDYKAITDMHTFDECFRESSVSYTVSD